jgi:hypothetical protein
MHKHPADELNEDLAADRMYSERAWNPVEQDPIGAHNLERRGQMLPLEFPWLQDRRVGSGASSSTHGAMAGFWWIAFGIAVGALIGARVAGIFGLTAGALVGAWLIMRLTSKR